MEGYVRSIYDYVENMADSLDEVANAVGKQAERLDKTNQRITELETGRLAKLESWKAGVTSKLVMTSGITGAVIGAAASQIARLFGGP